MNVRGTLPVLEEAIGGVRKRIARACRRAGRASEDVRLIGVTKGVPVEVVALAARAGIEELGENYVQELTTKREAAPRATWHYLGRLQRRAVPRVLAAADWVQTLEPGSAAERLARDAAGRPVDCLIEVDFTGRRVGAGPEAVEAFADRLDVPGIRLRGLMTVAPQGTDPRPWFARLRELRDRMRHRFEGDGELSMGMSSDLEVAVEEGATMVRVGTAIFGPRARR